MASLKDHLECASWSGFNVENIEELTIQLRELTRHVGRKEYREAGNLAVLMEARCKALAEQAYRFNRNQEAETRAYDGRTS